MSNNLKERLAEQRKWRTAQSASEQHAPKRRKWSVAQKMTAFIVGFPLVILIAFYIWVFNAFPPVERTSIPSTVTESAIITAEETSTTKAQVTMNVCAGNFDTAKLHVRFEPGLNSEVRGYLEEGETVIVQLGEQNEPITQIVDDVNWTLIQAPITGWVSTSHLCK